MILLENLPISTKWTLDATGDVGRSAIESVFMILVPKIASKGTGFLLSNGCIITNEHVVNNHTPSDVIGISSSGENIHFSNVFSDKDHDLCILIPTTKLEGGLNLADESDLKVGSSVYTWGYPLGYNGPSPLLSVGYLAGFKSYEIGGKTNKHLVVNGAFNPGNSGGPLFLANDNHVIGVVSSKHAPISATLLSSIEALSSNRSGIVFTASDGKGNTQEFVESQLVAQILFYFRSLTQVMIGEAISTDEVRNILDKNKFSF